MTTKNEILEYLDNVLHPLVSPERWNVYSELHDMVEDLPEPVKHGKWIPVTERLPKETGLYMVSIKTKGVEVLEEIYPNGLVYVSAYDAVIMHWGYGDKNVQAWMPIPKPYQEADHD